ncbi:AAA family ATPase [Rhizobium sp. FKL33]|uniref:AAA family ATPase n=1 Tax=Rhizobium sp. FKL33 TaxID=2562307 RepID=UPI0010C0BD04|nr:AAA family ATPase [Rhizobium sp. FKL33]
MRIRSLDLIRYGKFTDRSLDFGDRPEHGPDFHIIHGPNEAGKSTLFSAWLDFLYGIDNRTPYAFLHDYKSMRVSARLETAAGLRLLTRIKKPQASLLDEADQPVGDHLLLGDLGGLDRDAYRTMFSLDETTLEEGGRAILDSKGDLGQLLFSASAGLSELAQKLEAIRTETDGFHKPRASKTELADLKRRLEELKAERDRIDIAASEHGRLTTERDRARTAYETANRDRAALRVRLDRAEKRLSALPQAARLAALRTERAVLSLPPAPPEGWDRDVAALRRRALETDTALARLIREQQALSGGEDEQPVDPILNAESRFEALADLAARARAEAQDLPRRENELREADRRVADSLARLGRADEEDPSRLLLPAARLGAIRPLIKAHGPLTERAAAAAREARAAAEALDAAQEAIDREAGAGADAAALAWLSDCLAESRGVDLTGRIQRLERDVEAAKLQFDRRLAALRPWRGRRDDLVDLRLPPVRELADWRKRLEEADKTLSGLEADLRRLHPERAGLLAERASLADQQGVVSDAVLTEARAAREAAWSTHRASLSIETADAFRAALDADDAYRARRMTQAAEAARLAGLDQSLARLDAQTEALSRQRDDASTVLAALRDAFAAYVDEIAPGVEPEIARLEAWRQDADAALEALTALDDAERARDEAAAALDHARERLAHALAACGLRVDASAELDALTFTGRRFLDTETRRAALTDAYTAREADLVRRRKAEAEAKSELAAWGATWREALAGSWLMEAGEGVEPPTPSVAGELSDQLQALDSALSARAVTADRIDKMNRDIDLFTDAMRSLADDYGFDDTQAPLQIHRDFERRLRDAREDFARRRDAETRLAKLIEERAEIEAARDALAAETARLADHFGVEGLDGVEAALALIRRGAELDRAIAELAADLRDSLAAPDIAAAEQELSGLDRDTLLAEIEETRPAAEALDLETQRLYAAASAAEAKLKEIDGDDRVARLISARRTVLLDIEEGARRTLELRLGALAAEQALRLYRDRHRSSMMARASDAFAQLTRGAYRGLAAQRDGQQETLIALSADGASKQAGDLSKGAQYQLYLALRIAGYGEYAAARMPAPFIADDIMESFDDMRAEEALTQLSAMARSGQVIYLTHHQHIRDMAMQVCPGVRVHEL